MKAARLAAAAALALGALAALAGCGRRERRPPPPPAAEAPAPTPGPTDALAALLLPSFTPGDPTLDRVEVIEILARPRARDDPGYAVLARATRGAAPAGAWIGVFVVDSELHALRRVVQVFPAPRDSALDLRFDTLRTDSLAVIGTGSRGDTLVARAWPWKP